jgi:hypothetical protein
MAKQGKTARELADLIAQQIGIGGVMVAVNPDPIYGWHPTVITAPAQAINAQILAEKAAQELRALYDLADERHDNDRRPLSRPLLIKFEGRAQSLRTLGNAVSFLTKELAGHSTSTDWQHAVEAISVAQNDYTDAHRDFATNLVEHVCRTAGVLALA